MVTEIKEEQMEADQSYVSQISNTLTTDKGEYEALCELVNPIAQPLASRKLAKKIYKLVKKSASHKDYLRHGLADVQKALRKKERGIVILAGNVSPIDVYSHLPAICEEDGLPYVYTPSREHLGLAAGHKRPAIALLVKEHEDYSPLFEEVSQAITALVIDTENV
ncbi:ribosomal protein l7Ae/L30e/S12e/Gadd45 family domain-containing protein [Ditylenchus destructor]|uniref:H/ACA ribonucleoprotein complex subunit 2 n=1 Tax=Ditylenchus destructor TaxID=166010 RepID=A0AAD4N0L6_9BILA|nr:ribosomal protein l7Ae/L30e/S12e/Gadd45 family domain-containing protein [Ditylenchus destructor]